LSSGDLLSTYLGLSLSPDSFELNSVLDLGIPLFIVNYLTTAFFFLSVFYIGIAGKNSTPEKSSNIIASNFMISLSVSALMVMLFAIINNILVAFNMNGIAQLIIEVLFPRTELNDSNANYLYMALKSFLFFIFCTPLFFILQFTVRGKKSFKLEEGENLNINIGFVFLAIFYLILMSITWLSQNQI
ncbi:MAG: hypothetical protein ACR2PX_20820, partial [Endozoicomonas sp.]|uniref:hypothetical protein n=1 Tax=Endozoicomonas sp. TaxID=1892382 RepID=UPI003D9BD21C